MGKIKVCIIGVGNCASSLAQGLKYYDVAGSGVGRDLNGLMHWDIGGYGPADIQVVAAFDIDRRKVGRDVAEAIFAPPNCTAVFCPDLPRTGVKVRMGRVLDGVADHMADYNPARTFVVADEGEADAAAVVKVLKESGAQILLNYLPVGSEEATRFYTQCALDAGLGMVNNIPVFIASDPAWAQRFADRKLPVIGDDIKAQLGATITHRMLTDLSKKISKTEAVQSVAAGRIPDDNIHIGPSDYVPWQNDNKVCFIRMEGRLFGDVPMNLELRLSVEDSPNSAGVAIDAIRCCKLALDRGIGGALESPASYFMKHPPSQFPDDEAFRLTEAFIAGERAC